MSAVAQCCGITCLAGIALGACCCVTVSLILGCIELVLGLYSYFSSDWIKEHVVSIDGGPAQTMKLYEICDNWPPNERITKSCPPIEYEYAFVGMLFVSMFLPVVLGCLECCIKNLSRAAHLVGILINSGLIATAILFIISARQSGKIIGKEVVILNGHYNLHETMKVVAGSLVITFALLRCLGFISRPKIDESLEKIPIAKGFTSTSQSTTYSPVSTARNDPNVV